MSQPWSKIGELPTPTPSAPSTTSKVEEEEVFTTEAAAAEKEKLENAVEKFLIWIQTETSPTVPPTKTLIKTIHTDISSLLSSLFILSKNPQTSNPSLTQQQNPRMELLLTEILTKFNAWAPLIPVEDVEVIGLALSKLVWKDFESSGLSASWKRIWVKNLAQVYWMVGEVNGWDI